MKKAFTFLALLVACCGSLLWFGALRNRGIIRLHDKTTARAEVLKHIPLGSDIRQAENVLERSGFECALVENGRYNYQYKKLDSFALAEKNKKSPKLWGKKEVTWLGIPTSYWSVTIGYKNLRVTHVYVRNALVGFNL